MTNFYHNQQLKCVENDECDRFNNVDDRTLNLSIAAGYDLTPLIHFWGIQPEDPEYLKQEMLEHNLVPSNSLKVNSS